MTISKDQAFKLLKGRGISPEQEMTDPRTHEPIAGSSFVAQMYDRNEYVLEEVLHWLGY